MRDAKPYVSSIGVPAAPLAANGGPSGETYYITPDQLADLVADYEDAPRFGGIMMVSFAQLPRLVMKLRMS